MDNNEILDFLKDYKELFQDRPENLDWAEIYNLASARFRKDDSGKFTEFWLDRNIHPEKYLSELPKYFLYKTGIKNFEIPANVRSIGDYAFRDCTNLKSVTIPDSVTSIGHAAFDGCTSLISITIPDSVTSIDSFAFYECSSLKSINYRGTKEQWKNIEKELNSFSHAATSIVHCSDRDAATVR